MSRAVWIWTGLAVVAVIIMASKRNNNSGGGGASVSLPGDRRLTEYEVYSLARSVGFPPDVARRMVAIAIRESDLMPSAKCHNCFPGITEYSLGLWQINMSGSLGAARLAQFGISSPEVLLDPYENARAAYLTWGGSEQNLNIAWRIHEEGAYSYRSKYLAALNRLPNLDTLELAYSGANGGVFA